MVWDICLTYLSRAECWQYHRVGFSVFALLTLGLISVEGCSGYSGGTEQYHWLPPIGCQEHPQCNHRYSQTLPSVPWGAKLPD